MLFSILRKFSVGRVWWWGACVAGFFALSDVGCAGVGEDSLMGKPVAGQNADGQLEVFKVDGDGELRHRWQKPANGAWSAWCSLGGSVLPGVAITTNADGQMMVLAVDRTNHTLMLLRQKSPNSLDWLKWANLGGTVLPPVAVVRNADGRLEVFAVAADSSGSMKHLWQTNIHGGWSAWADLGGNFESGPAVALNGEGRLEAFGIDARTGKLMHCWQRPRNSTNNWSEWASLEGAPMPGFVLARSALGPLEVFAVNTNNSLVRIRQQSVDFAAPWSEWLDFGGDFRADPNLAVGQSADGRLEIYAIAAGDGAVMHRWETLSGGSDLWSPWTKLGESFAQPRLAAAANEDGNLEVFTADREHPEIINHRRQISFASDWLDWSSLDRPVYQYSSRTWQADEGLPNNRVQAITQTGDGFLWVGTAAGLARFDGMAFVSVDAKNTPELKNSSITALMTDRDGALWVGTDGGGLTRLKEGVWKHYGANDGLAGDNVKVIYKTSDGALWIGTTTGMSRFKQGKFANFTTKQGLFSDLVSYVYEDRDADLWVATSKGLNRLRGGEIMDSFNMPKGLPNDSVRAICQDKGGRIWIGSNNGVLWHNWYYTGSFYAYNTRYGLSDSFVTAICEDVLGNLWVGTYSGLNRFRGGRFFSELNNEGVPYGKVNALFEDRGGNLWVGSDEGLVRLTLQRFSSLTKLQGLSHNNIMSVMEDRAGGLWLGTWGGGANRLKDERVAVYGTTNGLAQDLVLALCEGRDVSVWMGADYDGGLTRLKNGKATRYTAKNGLVNAPVRVIHEDRAGKLWVGTGKGLSCLHNGAFTNYLAGNSVAAICEDHEGCLWFGTDGGLMRLKQGRFASFNMRDGLSDNSILALLEDGEHNLWIGTASGGLVRFKDGRFTACTTQQGLYSDEIFEILEDNQGWLWMSCSKGIFRVSKQELEELERGAINTVACVNYGRVDGMESLQCNGLAKPAGWKTRDGRLWFATNKGVVAVDPATAEVRAIPAPVYIERVSADRRGWRRVAGGRFVSTDSPTEPWAADATLRVPPGRGELEFQYTMPDFEAPEKCRFRYQLEGVDTDWVDAGSRRTARYNNVTPGSYHFRVMACAHDGIWSRAGASLAVVLRPHLWQTWWFRAVAAILIIGTATGVALQIGRRKMRLQLAALERAHAVEKERARIAKDMHDQLGAGLTQVGLLGELTRREAQKPEKTRMLAGKICDIAREQAQMLDEIVWTVDPKNDTLAKLAAYMAVYAEEYLNPTEIRCRVDVPPNLPPFPLSADLRHNLLLAVKEALNNAVKHSSASEVWVRFALNGYGLEIVIEDNGRGFKLESADPLGNGLSNMKQRVQESGGQFGLSSKPEKGTRVCFTIPLKGI